MSLREDAKALAPELVELRRELHQIPEIGLDLPRTQEKVLAALADLPLEVSVGERVSSVTAVLRGGQPGPAVLLRGDMDALPVTERTGEEFSSRHEGAMHACGHDLHTAGLVGAARLLSARAAELTGDVVFMFQPGEEGHDGARYMIEDGVLEAAGRPVEAAYGLHVTSSRYHKGVFAARPGPLMAASGGLFVRVVGAGGHGSTPHRTLDPVPAACEMVLALQTMVTRKFDVFEPVVVTVGTFHAGTRRNVIPDEASFEATVRAFNPDMLGQIRDHALRLCEDIGTGHGLRVEASYDGEYPLTANDPAEHDFAAATVRELFGEERYELMEHPMTGSEDFSRVLERVPGAFVFLGATNASDPDSAPTNHSPLARFDDSVLPDGAALLAELAVRRTSRRNRVSSWSAVSPAPGPARDQHLVVVPGLLRRRPGRRRGRLLAAALGAPLGTVERLVRRFGGLGVGLVIAVGIWHQRKSSWAGKITRTGTGAPGARRVPQEMSIMWILA